MKKLLALTTAFLLLPSLTKAQTDSLKNDFRIGLNFLAHGEICGGGLPRDINSTENHSAFILGRTRLALDYQRDNWFQVHLMLQNNAVWGMQGNQTLGLGPPVEKKTESGRIGKAHRIDTQVGDAMPHPAPRMAGHRAPGIEEAQRNAVQSANASLGRFQRVCQAGAEKRIEKNGQKEKDAGGGEDTPGGKLPEKGQKHPTHGIKHQDIPAPQEEKVEKASRMA